jgi:uncharacterized membrane protein YkvA (DUF1232 family)
MKKQSINKENLMAKAKATYQKQAENIASSRDKLKDLLNKAASKLKGLGESSPVKESITQVEITIRMVKAHVNQEYKGISNRTLGMLVLGLLYFVLPLDFIPDFIPVVGYIDDLTVILAIFKSLNRDIEKFLEWEKTKV